MIRPLLGRVGTGVALYRWVQWIEPRAHGYAPASAEGTVIDEALGRMISVLRRIAAELAERRERIEESQAVEIEEPEMESVT